MILSVLMCSTLRLPHLHVCRFFIIGCNPENKCKVDQYLTWQYHPVGKVQILEELAPFERFKIAEALEVDLHLCAYLNVSKCARMHIMIV